ncbi:hypothetical protein [Oharaeibacter diazotrophicus]|uniref:Uncharacterized protein n=1 Tax=Oharaeibacter diazotrophicus TaxID=1920512 RepID=A0A4R6RAQ4_9HYPH|nr:hypothetical protein [Oharaeibacter diazotrophicus]TDP83211.1 hypothetical protein EDD54_3168 [Oharaeibacter diazotrophicus]BBE72040.1 hypothetical protein OHA_1_01627 [Pleomorphomonas sp. SM30]GLS78805.1 hypothetical protein GCM10007904_41420 [Oharaeibacter diazotrophicus]
MARWTIGDDVLRTEDRPERRATVTAVAEGPDGAVYGLAYAEGGEGWWPEAALGEAGDAAGG